MRIGKEKHEKILTETIQQLEKEGYNLIRLDGKSPTLVAFKDNISYVICVETKPKSRTIIFLEDTYFMFDKVVRTLYDNRKIDRMTKINEVIKDYEEKGFRIIRLANKSPDAIAYKNNSIFAVEILGLNKGYSGKKTIQDKESIYDMFDGIMIKTFSYNSDTVFTETYGRSSISNHGVGGSIL